MLEFPRKIELLKIGCVTPMNLSPCRLFHINFMGKNIDDGDDASKEMFFTEISKSSTAGVSVRLCVSLGPINSLSGSGDKLNGCCYCRLYNNVWHPKSGGFVRGGDASYRTVQDICNIDQNNTIPDYEKHLTMTKQVSRSCEPKKNSENIAELVDETSLYATEALKFYNQGRHMMYELVKPGFVTCVILPTCLLFHVNFKAKETDVATPVEKIFFAELIGTSGAFSCKRCVILQPIDFITGDKTGDITNGCYYCHELNNVHHPTHGQFVRGGDSLYKPDKELELKGSFA
ncbi:uncharacterized protein LOC141707636 isoform X2 [Apium graveolens]|uniref:uncharacterized protein LOC141707636 isoform X2 n=1 Tax=Apium graveolens TaxID=4045 RepID=UPI003D7B711B